MDSILVVDDEHAVRELLYSMLSRRHWVATAADADEAITMLGLAHYDIMVTDYRMPGPDGLELIAEATTRWPELRAVLLSGYIDDDVRERANVLGVTALVDKPFDAAGFQAKIEEILAEIRSSRREALPDAAAG